MNKHETILAAMAATGGAEHSPVQMQKILFLLDRRIPTPLEGPHFDFKPYDYGPFDKDVYDSLEFLAEQGMVEIVANENLRKRTYRLTPLGLDRGRALLDGLAPNVAQYLRELTAFVRRLSFAELVSTVYRAYPEMQVNSIFRG